MDIIRCSCKRPVEIEGLGLYGFDGEPYIKQRIYICVCGKRYYQRWLGVGRMQEYCVTETKPDDWSDDCGIEFNEIFDKYIKVM